MKRKKQVLWTVWLVYTPSETGVHDNCIDLGGAFLYTQYNNLQNNFKGNIIHLYIVIYLREWTLVTTGLACYHNFTHNRYDRKSIGTVAR